MNRDASPTVRSAPRSAAVRYLKAAAKTATQTLKVIGVVLILAAVIGVFTVAFVAIPSALFAATATVFGAPFSMETGVNVLSILCGLGLAYWMVVPPIIDAFKRNLKAAPLDRTEQGEAPQQHTGET